MENVNQSNIDILSKGLEIVLNRYNEELKRGKTFNKRAMYPLSIIPVIFTLISFFIETLQRPIVDNHPSLTFCIVLIICLLYVVICMCFVKITIPKKDTMVSASSPDDFCKDLDKTSSIVAYYQKLIPRYLEDYYILYQRNIKKGWYLKCMNFLFLIIILLFMVILTLSYF